jgi:putative ABC transport system permease protein
VLRLVVRTGLALAFAGIVLGAAGSLLVTRGLASMLVEIQPTDAVTYAVVLIKLGVIAMLACWIPARCATRVDPVVALRYE